MAAGTERATRRAVDAGANLLARNRRRPTVRIRNQLIERYRGMVEAMARAMSQRLPASVEVGDLAHAGLWGLIRALEAWRPERGAGFVSFMRVRVRGAMIDELRQMDFLPRIYRQRARARDAALERLRAQLQREPSDAELAAELGVSERRFRLRYAGAHARLAQAVDADGEEEVLAGGSCPMDPVDRADLIRSIQGSLRPVEWSVLRLHYLDGLSGKEVARRLRLSPARVCQIHGRVLLRLKARLRGAV